jgi:hypothetical protein
MKGNLNTKNLEMQRIIVLEKKKSIQCMKAIVLSTLSSCIESSELQRQNRPDDISKPYNGSRIE